MQEGIRKPNLYYILPFETAHVNGHKFICKNG